ncbi:MAG: TIR domain-containing protein, partial [Nitrospira sp.]
MPPEKRLAFICYRNADSGLIAHSLHGQLSKKLGSERLFLAPASIDGGEKWPSEIEDALVAAVVMVVLIGRDWIRV